tara:strand:+ start:567 stop:995 length:429 start_codon:yes stop_codon:yes gene_type:complete
MKWLLLLFIAFYSSDAKATTPRFAANQIQSNSKSISRIDEVIITENYNSGYAYSVTGSNIKTDSYISPEATYTTSQNTGNAGAVNFEWITPQLTSKPQWQVVNEGEAFSLTENFMAPGLDAVSIINRTQTIETTQTSTTLFQ